MVPPQPGAAIYFTLPLPPPERFFRLRRAGPHRDDVRQRRGAADGGARHPGGFRHVGEGSVGV